MGSPEAKRKKQFNKNEVLTKLEENENDVKRAVKEMVMELSPFDITDENVALFEDRLDKIEQVSKSFTAKVYKLKNDVKARKFRKKPELLEEVMLSCSQHSVLQSEIDSEDLCASLTQSQITEADADARPSTYRKRPLNHNMTSFARRRRVSDKKETLQDWAAEEGVTVTELLGYFLHHGGDRSTAAVGWRLFTGEKVTSRPEVTIEEAIWIIERSGMSQVVWQEVRLRLLDRIWLPPVMNVRAENQRNRPALVEYRHGVKAPLAQCLSLTIAERLQHLDLSQLDAATMQIFFKFVWGLDGSGDQKDYNQLSKVDYSTKSMMSVCFSLREVKIVDDMGSTASWSTAVTGGANKPQNTRPLALFPAKENVELLQEFVPIVETEIRQIKAEWIELNLEEDLNVKACCQGGSLTMVDGKMVNNLLNCGGAYCSMCVTSQADAHRVEVIEAGFIIERSVESMKELAMALTDPATGDVIRRRADYETRQGVCGVPITESDITKNIPVCHSKIRVFEFEVELLVRLLSHQKWSSPTNTVRYTKSEKESYNTAREKLKQDFYKNIAVNIGNPGEMVTGKAFQTISSDDSRAFIVSLVPEEIRESLNQIMLGLHATVKVINSQKRKVNVEKLRLLTKETNLKLVETFPWAVISPSVHRVLAHSWEVVMANEGFGLGGLSEEGLEALNKYIREIRDSGSRKDSTLHNMTDTFNHLWDRSRPTIMEMEREIKRRKTKVLVSTEIEALVESLFLEEAED